jgi:hypothetical protein
LRGAIPDRITQSDWIGGDSGQEREMAAPISIQLETGVRATLLGAEAKSHGVRLATLLRQIATDAAREVRRKQIRAGSEAVARYIADLPEARELVAFLADPDGQNL